MARKKPAARKLLKTRDAVAEALEAAVPLPGVVALQISDIKPRYTRESNPNKMDDEKFALLTETIKHGGFDQPVLVSKRGETYVLEDGHHRVWAAKDAGLTHVLAVVKTMSDPRGILQGIGMNRLRGDLDLGQTAKTIQETMAETNWAIPQVSMLTGFTSGELEALLSTIADSEQVLDDVGSATPDLEEAPADKPFVLEISFASRADYKLVRRKLRKAAGKGKDLAVGLMNVLGEKPEAVQDEDDEDEETIHVEAE